MKRIGQRIMLYSLLIVFISVFILQFYNFFEQSNTRAVVKEQMSRNIESDFKALIKTQVETMVTTIEGMITQMEKEGKSEDEIKEIIVETVRNTTYGETGYFWIDDSKGNNVLLPPKPESEGSNRYDLKDDYGNMLIQEIIKAGMNGGGYTEYWFPKPDEEEPSLKISYSMYIEKFDWILGTGNYVDDVNSVAAEELSRIEEHLDDVALRLLGGAILILIVIFIASYFEGKNIARPIVELNNIMKKAQQGDLTVTYQTNVKDERGQLAVGFNQMIQSLQVMTKDNMGLSDKLSSSFVEIESIADSILQKSEQTSHTITNISEDIVRQAEATEDANEKIHDIVNNLDEINTNMNEAQNQANLSVEAISNGQKNIELQQEKMRLNVEAANEATKAINHLAEVAEDIVNVIDVIEAISSQTNLLALNASIEAARAGEAGKGFAVVADEIRKLAEQTMASTSQINEIITQVRDSVDVAVSQMEVSKSTVAAQEEAMILSVKGFEDISRAVQIINENVNTTAYKAYNVNKNANTASQQMNEVSQIAASTSEGMDLVSNNAAKQADEVSSIDLYIKGVSELIESLGDSVKRFKL